MGSRLWLMKYNWWTPFHSFFLWVCHLATFGCKIWEEASMAIRSCFLFGFHFALFQVWDWEVWQETFRCSIIQLPISVFKPGKEHHFTYLKWELNLRLEAIIMMAHFSSMHTEFFTSFTQKVYYALWCMEERNLGGPKPYIPFKCTDSVEQQPHPPSILLAIPITSMLNVYWSAVLTMPLPSTAP